MPHDSAMLGPSHPDTKARCAAMMYLSYLILYRHEPPERTRLEKTPLCTAHFVCGMVESWFAEVSFSFHI